MLRDPQIMYIKHSSFWGGGGGKFKNLVRVGGQNRFGRFGSTGINMGLAAMVQLV